VTSTVYGPVEFWRVARSLGVDLPSTSRHARTMSREEAARFESRLHELTGLKIVSAFCRGAAA